MTKDMLTEYNIIMRLLFFKLALPVLIFVASIACDDTPYKVRIMDYDIEKDAYRLRAVEIETLKDINRLEGRATSLIGGAKIEINFIKQMMSWDKPGRHVAFRAIKSDGVYIPEDFDSLAMVSIYYNMEHAMLFFESLGMPHNLSGQLNTYYWPDLTITEKDGNVADTYTMEDNAFYMYTTQNDRNFYVFPYKKYEWLPMGMNLGIMTHEYTHSVFDSLVVDPTRNTVGANMENSSKNFLYGLNEGCADFMAFASTADPDFMLHSIRKNTASSIYKEIVRDCSDITQYDKSFDSSARSSAVKKFYPYDIGSFFASTLYEIAQKVDASEGNTSQIPSKHARQIVAKTLYRTLENLGNTLTVDFELWDFFNLFVSQTIDDNIKKATCDTLEKQYAMYYSEIVGC